MRLLLILTLSFVATGVAQEDLMTTAEMNNGRVWNVAMARDKLLYVVGIHDSIVWKAISSPEKITNDNVNWAVGFVVNDYISELDAFYKDTANIRIPLPVAVDYCTRRLRGQIKKDDLEVEVIRLRKLTSDWK
jgi:hypothetical protein